MVTVNLVGGARKSFQTDSLEITQSIDDISELLSHLISKKPEIYTIVSGKGIYGGTITKKNSKSVKCFIPTIM